MATTSYSSAPNVKSMMDPLIASCHKELGDIRIECVFSNVSTGTLIDGQIRIVDDISAFLVNSEKGPTTGMFVLVIGKDSWCKMSPTARIAMLDHLLTRCGVQRANDGTISLFERHPDLADFVEVVKRHGMWQLDQFQNTRPNLLMSPWFPFRRGAVVPMNTNSA